MRGSVVIQGGVVTCPVRSAWNTLDERSRPFCPPQRRLLISVCAACYSCWSMTRDFFDPTPEQQNVVLVEAASLRKAEQTIVPQMLPLTFSQDLPTLTICRFRLCMVGPCYVDFRKLIKC